MPEILKVSARHSEEDIISRAAALISRGGVIAYPTETIYGLGADATNEEAICRIFEIKGRNFNHPISVIIGAIGDVDPLVRKITDAARILMNAFWPGPLTIVFEAADGISPLLTAGTGKIGVRLSGLKAARKIAEKTGRPITSTSANLSGAPVCTTSEQVVAQLGDKIDAVIALEEQGGTVGSTIIDITSAKPIILRTGVISIEELERKAALKIR
jgi:L-threonylcarbamoyladenylate synthase